MNTDPEMPRDDTGTAGQLEVRCRAERRFRRSGDVGSPPLAGHWRAALIPSAHRLRTVARGAGSAFSGAREHASAELYRTEVPNWPFCAVASQSVDGVAKCQIRQGACLLLRYPDTLSARPFLLSRVSNSFAVCSLTVSGRVSPASGRVGFGNRLILR